MFSFTKSTDYFRKIQTNILECSNISDHSVTVKKFKGICIKIKHSRIPLNSLEVSSSTCSQPSPQPSGHGGGLFERLGVLIVKNERASRCFCGSCPRLLVRPLSDGFSAPAPIRSLRLHFLLLLRSFSRPALVARRPVP